jgi:CHAT domain-containing protein/tetratricopeptide (TPR) repeat protein
VAGLKEGDVIVQWDRGERGGEIESPFDMALVEQREAPCGPVRLAIRRGWRRVDLVLPNGIWRVETRPVLGSTLRTSYEKVEGLLKDGQVEDALAELGGVADHLAGEGRVAAASWVELQRVIILEENDRTDEANDLGDQASQALGDDLQRAVFRQQLGHNLVEAGRVEAALEAFRAALELYRDLGIHGPLVAHLLLEVCRTDLRKCEGTADEALAIYREVNARSLEVADALRKAGAVAYYRSDWEEAEGLYRQGLDLQKALAPQCPGICDFLGNIGLVALKRGDFDTARRLFWEGFREAERLGSPPEQIGYAANYLGLVAMRVGQFGEARIWYERALESFQKIRPGGREEAGVLTNIGNVAIKEEDWQSAREFHRRALELRERIHPGGSDVAASLNNLGIVLRLLRLDDEARENLERALKIKRELSPESGWVANTLSELGQVAFAQGRFQDAEALYREALDIRRSLSPDHPLVAQILFLLGQIRSVTDRAEEAEVLYREAIAISEDRALKAGIPFEERAGFDGWFFGFYRAFAEMLTGQGRTIEAFEVMERARSGAVLARLNEQISPPAGVPPDLWFAKKRSEVRIRRIEGRRDRVNRLEDREGLDQLNLTLRTLQDDYGEILEKIATFSPRFKIFDRPKSVSFSEMGRLIEPGSVMLSYCISQGDPFVMVVTVGSGGLPTVEAVQLSIDKDELKRRVGVFLGLIGRGKNDIEVEAALKTQSEKLFNILIRPAKRFVDSADRLLIIPDNPLFDLPFGALVDGEDDSYLGVKKALVLNVSAGVLAGIRHRREEAPLIPSGLVAFGEPARISKLNDTRFSGCGQLPGSRHEVEAIGKVFGSDSVVLIGWEATEEAVRTRAPGAAFIHFAVHAVVDKRVPLNSALLLAQGEGVKDDPPDDGILTAAEVIDGPAISADVVTLSGCGTGSGAEIPGEGVVGLAWAFQVAGARSVVATLWPVNDEHTVPLMVEYYRRLHQGEGPADALRDAQADQVAHGGARAHPFNWAAFQVMGDWKGRAQ